MTDVFEIDERFMPIATLDIIAEYMQCGGTEEFVRKLVKKKKIADKSDDDYELTVQEAGEMLRELSLRVVADFLQQTRH